MTPHPLSGPAMLSQLPAPAGFAVHLPAWPFLQKQVFAASKQLSVRTVCVGGEQQ
jgi:hypothetical protein